MTRELSEMLDELRGYREKTVSLLTTLVNWNWARTGQHLESGRMSIRQIVEHTLKGHSAAAVGQILSISPGTVRIHRRNIYAKLRISSQGELFSKFIGTLGQD